MGGSFGRGGSVYKISRPQNTKLPEAEEESTDQDTTKEDLRVAGNGGTVQGQSLRGNGPTVQGQGLFEDLFNGATNIVKAAGDGAAKIAGAVAPDTVNLTPTINNVVNGVSVAGLKRNPNLRRQQAWLPDDYSQIFRIVCVWPFGLLDYGSATLRCKI